MGQLKALVNDGEGFSLIRGEDASLLFRIFDDTTKAPHPMGSGSTIEVTFPLQEGSLVKSAEGYDWQQGLVQVMLSAAESETLKAGKDNPIQIKCMVNGRTRYCFMPKAMSIVERIL